MAVSFLMKVKNPAGQAVWYMELLADYEFTLSHRKGASNVNADGLSKTSHVLKTMGSRASSAKNMLLASTT